MVYNVFNIEEDERKYREFLDSQLFRNASKALTHLETDAGGLTAAEVWQEVENLLVDLRTTDADDREDMVSLLYSKVKRRVRIIRRDDESAAPRTDAEVERTTTCVLYCLALRLEATTRKQDENPHNDLLDELVDELIRMHHPVLAMLYHEIKTQGDKNERRNKVVPELDPLKVEDKRKADLLKVVNHYANRIMKDVEYKRRDAFSLFWDKVMEDDRICQLLMEFVPISGDEHKELGITYNAKAMFNIYGMLLKRGVFSGVKGPTPLAKRLTEHEDCDKLKMVSAKYEYFNTESVGIDSQFDAMSGDMKEHVAHTIQECLRE